MRIPHLSTAVTMVVLAFVSACATEQPTVVEKLDEVTAVTVTYSRTPLIMSPDTPLVREARRDYVQLGAIEVNRMGAIRYFLWLGITEADPFENAGKRPDGFESIVFAVGDESLRLDVGGWTPAVIGTSDPVYQKLFANSADAYYPVTLDQIRFLTDSDNLTLRTTGAVPKEFVSWYKQTTFDGDLAEFLRTVSK